MENLSKGGLHLTDDGKVILADDIIHILNRFIFQNEKFYNGTFENDFPRKVNFYNDNDESSNISDSSEVQELYPSVGDDLVGSHDLKALCKNVRIFWILFVSFSLWI